MTKRGASRARVLEERGQMGLGFSVSEMTRVPETTWQPPDLSQLPDRLGGNVGVDLETTDEGLSADQGPGWAWHGGEVIGYSVTADNCSVYLPIGHVEGNVDPDQSRRWLNHVLKDKSQTKLFANAMYDIGWSRVDGVEIKGPVIDVQLVEATLDEYRYQYSLEAIAVDRIGEKKDERILREAAQAYGVDPKKEMAKLPARFAGDYASWDSSAPRRIWEVQRPVVEAEKLERIVKLEHDLLPMYMDMRQRGVPINVERAEKMRDRLEGEVAVLVNEVKRECGFEVAIWEPQSLAKVLDHLQIPYGKTAKTGAPSIGNDLLENADNSITTNLFHAREKSKLCGTFVEGQLLKQLKNGRLHGNVHPLKSDDGGTVTGRTSMSDPNLQFIPTRTDEGRLIRCCFIPEDGEMWMSPDMSQQEVRLLVHFAILLKMRSAYVARDSYLANPDLNYHDFVADVTGLPYKAAKILNFAIIYGRGIKETAIDLGMSIEETKALFKQHGEKMPFARSTSWRTQDRVKDRGYLTSLLGRRMRFPFYEPEDWDARNGRMLRLEEAEKAWPGATLTRARLHKALNSLIQPSAADQTKKAMLDVWNAGLGKHVYFQVHDELDGSVPDKKIADQVGEIMRDAVKLEVPVAVDVSTGPSWGEVE